MPPIATRKPRAKKPTPLTVENFEEVFVPMLEKALPQAYDKITGKFWNGSDVPVEKPIRAGMSDISLNMRTATNDIAALKNDSKLLKEGLEANTAKTNDSYELLQPKRDRVEAVTHLSSYVLNVFQTVNKIIPVSAAWRIIAGIIGLYAVIHGVDDIIQWIKS